MMNFFKRFRHRAVIDSTHDEVKSVQILEQLKPSQTQDQGNIVSLLLRQFLEVIRNYGMPIAAFATGIYAFIVVLISTAVTPEIKIGVALVLTVMGLVAQLWLLARFNPPVQAREISEQLERLTKLVEDLVQFRIKRNLDQ